jgi:hypothetical protein
MTNYLLTGLWQTAQDDRYVWYGADWLSFTAKAKALANSGYSLESLDVADNGGLPLWAGNWVAATRTQELTGGMSWVEFQNYKAQSSLHGLELFRLRSYADPLGRRWAGVWQSASAGSVVVGPMPWSQFWMVWLAQHATGNRLIDFDTYSTNGSRLWTGVWRPGTINDYIWVDADWSSFIAKSSELRSKGYRLNTVHSYSDGANRRWAGLWAATAGGFLLVSDMTEEQFWAQWDQQAASGMMLSGLHIWRGSSYAPAQAAKACIRLHIKILSPPTIAVNAMLDRMREVYEPAGFVVDVGSVQNLNHPNLIDLDTGSCSQGAITAAQQQLFAARENMGTLDIAAFFVRTTLPPYNGCAAYPPGRPSVVISSYATEWTLAHEVGHILGLYHVNNNTRLMTGLGTANIVDPPPDLIPDEIATMMASPYAVVL